MSIILNERKWAEDAINSAELGKKPGETLIRISKYYYACGKSKSETKQLIERFLLRCDPSASLVLWADTIDYALRSAAKYPLVEIDKVVVTDTEMEKIRTCGSIQLQRLAFTLLCISKYLYTVSSKTDHWVSTPDKDIMSMANINTSVRRQSALFSTLRDAGMIKFSKKVDNLSVQVLFADEGKPELEVTDFRNLGYQYLMYLGQPYFTCKNCGIATKIREPGKGRPPMYCAECANEIYLKQTVNSVMRTRHNERKIVPLVAMA